MVALLDILLSKVRLEQDMTEVFLILQEGLSAPNKQLLESTELIPDLNQLLQEY